jgi:hypothetical protein
VCPIVICEVFTKVRPKSVLVVMSCKISVNRITNRNLTYSHLSLRHITTDGQSVSKSWYRAPSGAHEQIFITVWQLRSCFCGGALSDERTGLSFLHSAGPCQRSLSRVRVPRDSRPYFTVSVLRLSFSSPRTTLRITVEVFPIVIQSRDNI